MPSLVGDLSQDTERLALKAAVFGVGPLRAEELGSLYRTHMETSHPSSLAIVNAIIDLAHALEMWVVAEGVETPEQRVARPFGTMTSRRRNYLRQGPVPGWRDRVTASAAR